VISRVCICCGEPFTYGASQASGNPNICEACSQLADETIELWEVSYAMRAVDPDFETPTPPPNAS
jgi:hypothetical protein